MEIVQNGTTHRQIRFSYNACMHKKKQNNLIEHIFGMLFPTCNSLGLSLLLLFECFHIYFETHLLPKNQ